MFTVCDLYTKANYMNTGTPSETMVEACCMPAPVHLLHGSKDLPSLQGGSLLELLHGASTRAPSSPNRRGLHLLLASAASDPFGKARGLRRRAARESSAGGPAAVLAGERLRREREDLGWEIDANLFKP
jgi:hypothetical protein